MINKGINILPRQIESIKITVSFLLLHIYVIYIATFDEIVIVFVNKITLQYVR